MRKLIFWIILTTAAYGQISGAGQLGCAPTPVTGTAWSSATGSNTTQTLLIGVSAAAALVQLNQTTTITGGAGTFELSYDGTNWVTIPLSQIINPATGAQLTNPYTFQASTNKPFYIPLNGATNLRIRLSTVITGTGTVTPVTTPLCSFAEAQTATDASGNLLVNINANSNGNLPINIVQIGGAAQSVTNPLFSELTDGTNAMGAMANFGTSPGAVKSLNINASIMSGTTALGTPNTFGTTAPTGNALGVNASLFCGTTLCTTASAGVQKVGIVGNAGATLDAAGGSSAPTNSVSQGGTYNTTAPTPASGQQEPVQLDPYSNLKVNSNTIPSVTAVQVNNKVSGAAGTSLTNAFGANTVPGNSILCVGFEGVAATPVFTDAQSNTYIVAESSGAAAPGYTVALASNIVGGTTDTITLTTSSGSASFSCYELKGSISIGQIWDYATFSQGTSATLVYPQESAAIANDFAVVAVGMGAGTINATPSIAGVPSVLTTVDQANTAPLGTAALSVFYSAHSNVTNSPTFTQSLSLSASETYSAILVAVKPASVSLIGNVPDPCQQGPGSPGAINQTANAQLITGVAGKQVYICTLDIVTATGQNIALVEGTGSTCGTNTAGMAGGATAATGWNFAANGGLVKGIGGFWVYKTATSGDNVCLLQSGSGQASGGYRFIIE